MKKGKVINIVKHKMTGAEIPVILNKVDENNEITDYREHTEGRCGFKLRMLEERWNLKRDEVLDLLKKYQVPGHLSTANANTFNTNQFPVDDAIFFEEYIYGLENKEKLTHNKLKSRLFI